jgi:hypothetical protein
MSNPIICQATVQTPLGPLEMSISVPVNANSEIDTNEYSLTASATTIAVPSWAVLVIIQPNSANTNTLTLKLNSGDTARNISPISPTLLALDNANLPTDIYLTSSGTDTHTTAVTFL